MPYETKYIKSTDQALITNFLESFLASGRHYSTCTPPLEGTGQGEGLGEVGVFYTNIRYRLPDDVVLPAGIVEHDQSESEVLVGSWF